MKRPLDLDAAFEEVDDVLQAFLTMRKWQGQAPFSGGVLDAWPARGADGLAFAAAEWRVVQAYVRQQLKGGERG